MCVYDTSKTTRQGVGLIVHCPVGADHSIITSSYNRYSCSYVAFAELYSNAIGICQKGKDLLFYGGCLFVKEKSDSDKIIWKCMMYKKIKCPSRMHTRGNDAIKQPNDHVNHAPDPAKAAVKTVVSEMKQRASTGQKTTPNPRSLDELVIPPDYQRTLAGHPFLLRDTGDGPNRILLFSTDRNLELLSQSQHWFADGTFIRVVLLTTTIFSIMPTHLFAEVCIFVFMTNP